MILKGGLLVQIRLFSKARFLTSLPHCQQQQQQQQQRYYSKDDHGSSSDDDEPTPKSKSAHKDKKTSPNKTEAASDRLNRLLASMPTENKDVFRTLQPVPGENRKKLKEAAIQAAAAKDVFTAAKNVAAMIDGEANQLKTESELLAKLLGHDSTADHSGLRAASNNNRKALPNDQKGDSSLSELIVGMKIDRSHTPKTEQSRSDFVRRTIASKRAQLKNNTDRFALGSGYSDNRRASGRQKRPVEFTGTFELYGKETLGIFKNPSELRQLPDLLSTWAQLQEHKLQLLVTHPPTNYFEKMARWTETGKLWRFPIDNEQDNNEEIDVDFSEHIFLEQHLVPWCPDKGPIRHFMELVCVGLSKNPYLSAIEKKEHILWYRDYFAGKKELLNEFLNPVKQNQHIATQ